MNEIRPLPPQDPPLPDIDPDDLRPVVIVASELRGRRDFDVVREDDDTDEDYASRCALVSLILDHAEKV